MQSSVTMAILGSLALAGLFACASTGRSSAESTVSGITGLRADATAGKAAVKSTTDSMNAIENAGGGDLKPPYDAFLKETKALDSVAAKAKSNGQAMRERGAAYFKTWEEQIGTMTNPDIKKRSEERRGELNKLYADLTTAMDDCRQKYEKFSTDLTDIKKALDIDLSPNGVKNLAKPMKTTRADGDEVTSAIENVEKRLDALAREMNSIQGPKT